ncbi:hypothetical protein Syun_001569 [Stephania yunnanensis]|uniref:Uncharacterized protein n=1 Tax=Stephania yunnanensis TaxID=152371 RepID=A0AAP0LJN8_9MAGN
MLHNVAGPSFNWNAVEESPNPQARQLYDMIDASREQLWPGCQTMTTLSAMARLLAIKSEHHISERGYNGIIKLMKDYLPNDNSMVENFYATKRLMRGLVFTFMSGSFHRSLSTGYLLPFDPEIEKTCRQNSKETRQRNHFSRVQLNDEQPLLMVDHIGIPHAPVAPREGQEEPLAIPPR